MRHLINPEIDIDDERDEPLERRITDMGQTAIIYPTDPHGFWRIRLDRKKTVPQGLDGCFTGYAEATKAITVYFNQLKAETNSGKTSS